MTLSEWLHSHGRTHQWLAQKAGVDPSQVSRISRGLQWPTARVAATMLGHCPGLSWDEWLVENSRV